MPDAKRDNLLSDIQAFLLDAQARALSPRTLQAYQYQLQRFATFLEGRGVCDVQDVTAQHVRAFLADLQQSGHNPGGCSMAFRCIRTWQRWAWREHDLPGLPPVSKVLAPRVPDMQLPPLDLDDLRRMLATCQARTFAGDRDRAMMLVLLDSGCRAREFLALDIQDVDWVSGAVIVHGKGNKWRTAFVGASTRRELVRWLRYRQDATGALWTSASGQRLTISGLRSVMRRRAAQAGCHTPSLHAFRRAFALGMLRGGCDIMSLQKLLGHSSLAVLRRYVALAESDLQAAHAAASPVDRLLTSRKKGGE